MTALIPELPVSPQERAEAYARVRRLRDWGNRAFAVVMFSAGLGFVVGIAIMVAPQGMVPLGFPPRFGLFLLCAFGPASLAMAWDRHLFRTARRILDRVDADLDRIPEAEMRSTAYLFYGHCSISPHAPCVYERTARIWLARGEIELPHGARPFTAHHLLPTPYPRRPTNR